MDEKQSPMISYHFYPAYDPGREYTRREMRDLIRPHRELLCFFAQASGYRRCVLGLDFGSYDPDDGSVPVLVMEQNEARVMLEVHGRRFKRAYERSRCGRSLLVTYTTARGRGWFQMDWKLDAEQVQHQTTVGSGDLAHNPVVAYLLVDETYTVIGPPGKEIDPAFYSEAEARRAAETYGRAGEVHDVVELYLEGILNVLFDEGDIMVDGRTAQRFVEACVVKGLRVSEKPIDSSIHETVYSCRELLGV